MWEVFQAERPALIAMPEPFDGFQETTVSASKTCLIRFDRNRYSVAAVAAAPVQVRAYADRIVVVQRAEGWRAPAGLRARRHALQSAALPADPRPQAGGAAQRGTVPGMGIAAALTRVRTRLGCSHDADRQFVAILGAILTDGLDAVEAACHEALKDGRAAAT